MSAVRVGSLCYNGGCLFFLRLRSRGFQDLLRLNPPSLLMLFGCISISKYPKENILHKEHGESLKLGNMFLTYTGDCRISTSG